METVMWSKMDFDQLVRIYVDTDADTHFIVSAQRTSSIAELREVIKATHRHCYPASGDVNIGKLAVPGGDFGYYLADYLCIGQVFDKWEGKVFAEVQSKVKPLTNDQGTRKSQALNQRPISTPKKLHFMPDYNNDSQWRGNEAQGNIRDGLEHQNLRELSFQGPVGSEVQVNGPEVLQLKKVFKVPKVHKRKSGTVEKASSSIGGVFARVVPEDPQRVDHLLDSQAPFTQPAEEPNVLPVGFSVREDAKSLEDRPVSTLLKEGIQSEAAGTAIGQPRRKKKKEKVRKGASVVSEGDLDPSSLVGNAAEDVGLGTRGVRRKREGSESIQRVSKLQKMTEATPSCGTLKIHALDGDLVRKDGKSEKVNKGKLFHGEILASRKELSVEVNPGEVSTSAVSGLHRKRRKKREFNRSFINSEDILAAREKEQGAPVGVMSIGLNRVKGSPEKEKVIDLEASTRADFEHRHSVLEDKPKNADNGILEVNAGSQLPGNDARAKPENPDVVVKVERQFTVEAVKGKRKKNGTMKGSATNASGLIGSGSTSMGYPVSVRPLLEKHLIKDAEIPSLYTEPLGVKELAGKDLDEGGMVEVGLVDEHGKQSVTKDHVVLQVCEAVNGIPDERDVTPGVEAFCCTKVERALDQEMADPVERLEIPLSSRLQSGTTQGWGAPSGTSMHESSLDKGIETIKCDTASQIKRQLTPKQAEEKQSHSSKISGKSKYKSERPKSLSKAFASSLSEIKAGKQVVSASQLPGKKGEEDARSSSTSESSGDGEPTRASQLETGSRLKALDSRKDRHRGSQASQGFEIVERSDGLDNMGVKRRREEERREEKIGTLEALSQDLPFQVAPTQAGKAFSGSTTKETSNEDDLTEYTCSEKEYHRPEQAHGHSSANDGTSDAESSGGLETSKPTDPASNAMRVPAPLVSRISAVGRSQSMKRRASGLSSDIEYKFAQFIDSQNGLDDIMGITLSQRNRSLPVEPTKQVTFSEAPSTGTTGSPAAASGSPVEVVFATQDSQVDNLPPTERSLIRLEKCCVADISQEPLSAIKLTAEFKVPKPVLIGAHTGLTNGGATHSGLPSKFKLSLEKQNPTLGGSERVTKTQVESDIFSRQEKEGAEVEKVVPVLTRESGKDVPLAMIPKCRNVEPSTLPKETNKGGDSAAAADRQGHTNPMKKEKNPTKNKAVSEFVAVNNTDHLAEQEKENKKSKSKKGMNRMDLSMDQPESSGAKGLEVRRSLHNSGAGESENNPSKSTSFMSSKKSMKQQRESKVKREKIETGADGFPSISGLESSERRKKKKKGIPQKGLPNQPNILPEASVDQSALETEELYLKMEKLNNEFWLQEGGSSSKEKDTGRSPSLMSGAKFATEADDTEVEEVERQMRGSAHISSEHGEPKLDSTDSNRPLATGEANLGTRFEGRDGHQDSHLLAGTEASDREEDAILSQGHKEESPEKAGIGQSPDVNETTPPKQTDMRKRSAVFDFQSEDERPTVKVSKSAEMRTNAKANWMDEVSERAVERVLGDEMLYVAEPEASKKSRKDANPKKWTVRMRGALPSALAASLLQGVDAAAGVRHGYPTGPSRTDGPGLGETLEGVQIDKNLIKAENAEDAVTKKAVKKPKRDPQKRTASGVTCCPVGCGKIYSGKTSAWYLHKKVCTGAPPQ